ncbi:MAG: aldo/keto reductase [Erysipelotrichaceae bacterium]|jgi:aryl-alcohol dehydrogenase-like predicted oxidoreductase|nr:aldo/keto reductase [Erysipelotrichaceae bacterium]MCI1326677.1 aldo/keto reductase [Solobacterium sp.]MCH4045426.1 aldo/keto reductase [Erysipelotrichaceae bacterium]MCH4122637.1 aldo/keto reductase [Erysipelotrichaceae bacterium]MCI1363375.1 aldo/keto reductase [Solobacterium sp.]
MEYVRLGSSGLKVSKICLGTMGFGTPGELFSWTVGYETSEAIVRECLDLGINFFDTANVYSNGEAEQYLGKAIRQYGNRDEAVIATKVGLNMDKHPRPNTVGLSRKVIFSEVEKSLTRLGTDYIDVYIIHHPDAETPVEETMEALDDLIRSGKVRYIGASNMKAWQFAKYQYIARMHGWHEFICLENMHNIFVRQDEREVFPMLEDMGVSLMAYKVLAGGRLSRSVNEKTARSATQPLSAKDLAMNDRIQQVADAHHCSKADVLIAYELYKKPVDTVLIGTTKPGRMSDTVKALDIHLSDDEIALLEKDN